MHFITGFLGNKKILRKIQKYLANATKGDYSSDDWETVASHYRNLKKTNHDRFQIDDITWNDLEMNQVFKRLNFTLSSPGEECLYHILREPCFEVEEISRRKGLIDFFRLHPEKRSAIQIPLYLMGKNRDLALSDCLFSDLDARPDRALLIYRILAAFPLLAGILVFFWQGAVFILFLTFC